MRDRLVSLVLSGDQRASAGLLSDWESAQDPLEGGRWWAVLDSAGRRVAVVETTELRASQRSLMSPGSGSSMPARASGASSNGVRLLGLLRAHNGHATGVDDAGRLERFRLVTGHELAARATAAR